MSKWESSGNHRTEDEVSGTLSDVPFFLEMFISLGWGQMRTLEPEKMELEDEGLWDGWRGERGRVHETTERT